MRTLYGIFPERKIVPELPRAASRLPVCLRKERDYPEICYFLSMEELAVSNQPKLGRMRLEDAYEHCAAVVRGHYENFPVGSLLIPKRHRPAVAAVYAFARYGDDIADEGDAPEIERLSQLDRWRHSLAGCLDTPELPEFIALGDTIVRYGLEMQPFHRLLDAFEQDVVKQRYESFAEVLHYCERSANPVGRIVLGIFGRLNEDTAPPADALCTGLQLANFWQDVSVDIRKPRVYIPEEDMRRFGVVEADLRAPRASNAFKALMEFEVHRAREYFYDAASLFRHIPFQLRLELTAVWRGGMSILDAIVRQDYDVLKQRPALSKRQFAAIVAGSIFPVSVHRP